jgi:integrase
MSTIRDSLVQYVAIRRALGSKFGEPAGTLSQFVDFLEREGKEFVTTQAALRWAMEPQHVQHATWARRLDMVRGFARWLSALDPRTEVPPGRLIGRRRRRRAPHIYSPLEIERLMAAASRLSSPTGLRALTYSTLIGLLVATGLRPGEALALDRSDVDLVSGVLSIRQTKFGKSRFTPIDESTRIALAGYAKRRDAICSHPRSMAFLLSENGKRLSGFQARRTFAKMSCRLGLRATAEISRVGRGPRLQDFRHTFTTGRLVEWYRAGVDVQRELPKLATYLGHVDVGLTYWYIEAVPELLQLASDRCDVRMSGVAP